MDGSGDLDLEVFQTFMRENNIPVSEEELEDLVHMIDHDNSGSIDVHEFLHWYHHEHSVILKRQRQQGGFEHFMHGDEMNYFGHADSRASAMRSLVKKLLALLYRAGSTVAACSDEFLLLALRCQGEQLLARPAVDTTLPPEPDTEEERAAMRAGKEAHAFSHVSAVWDLRPADMRVVQEVMEYDSDVSGTDSSSSEEELEEESIEGSDSDAETARAAQGERRLAWQERAREKAESRAKKADERDAKRVAAGKLSRKAQAAAEGEKKKPEPPRRKKKALYAGIKSVM